MSKYIDFTPETASEEYALLAGRVEAFANYVVQKNTASAGKCVQLCWDLNCQQRWKRQERKRMCDGLYVYQAAKRV